MSDFVVLTLVLLLVASGYAAGRVHGQVGYRDGYRSGYRQAYADASRRRPDRAAGAVVEFEVGRTEDDQASSDSRHPGELPERRGPYSRVIPGIALSGERSRGQSSQFARH